MIAQVIQLLSLIAQEIFGDKLKDKKSVIMKEKRIKFAMNREKQ